MVNSDGEDLRVYYYYEYMKSIKIGQLASVAVILLLFLLLSFFHKMAGVELFHVYQLIFCVVLLENRVTVFYAILKLFTYTQINPLYFLNERNNLKITNKVLEFNSQNQLFSYAVLIAVYCACALAFGVLYAVEQLKGLSLSHLKRFVYNVFIFPFAMAFFFIAHCEGYQLFN